MRPSFPLSLYLFVILFSFSALFAQTPDWSIVTSAGGTGNDRGTSVATDEAGNAYVAGYFYQQATFGSHTITANLYKELFIAKMSSSGTWLWAVNAGSNNHSEVLDIVIDEVGNAYVTGVYNGTGNFGGHAITSTAYSEDIFVAKINASGVWQWAATAGGSEFDQGYSIGVDNSGNTYITGQFQDTANFGTTALTSSGNSDVFIAKLSAAGSWLGALGAGSTGPDQGYTITVDTSNNIFVAGNYTENITFGTTQLINTADNNIFVTKLNSFLSYIWASSADGGIVNDITTDGSGNAYLSGGSEELTAFGPYTVTGEIFLAKINASGTWVWAVGPGGSYWGDGQALAIDAQGNIYLTGNFDGEIIFGSHTLLSNSEMERMYVAKLNANGTWGWAIQAGGISTNESHAISVNETHIVSITGGFYNTVEFGSETLTSSGSRDIFYVSLYDTSSFAANFSADITEGTAPLTINFSNISIGNPDIWEWDFQNDGIVDSYLQNPQWSYPENGVYTVSLTISDGVRSSTTVKEGYINLHLSIPDDNFRIAINDHLGQASDYYPTLADLHSITPVLSAAGYNISSIEGAQYLTNVISITVANNQITDLGPLANMENIRFIFAEENLISDISNLSNIPFLSEISLSNNLLSNISSLSRFPSLNYVYLSNNQIIDLSPLSDLQNLTQIEADNNLITDVSALRNQSNIDELYLHGNRISDIAPLIDNQGLGAGDNLYLYHEILHTSNPLSREAIQVHYDILFSRGFNQLWFPPQAEDLAPCYPTPARNSEDILPTTSLEWRGNYAHETATYELWLGTSPDELNSLGIITATNDTLFSNQPTLMANTEYWWKVRAVSSSQTIWSGLWHFSTATLGTTPVADFSANILSGEIPLLVSFEDLSEGNPNTWEWDFENDGTIDSYEQNPQYQYNEAGNYSISLTVSNAGGSDTEIKESYITVSAPENTFSVKQDGTGDYTSIQAAIDGVSDTHTIIVYPGTYLENIDFGGKNIIVESLFASTQNKSYIAQTIINGGHNGNVIRINDGEDRSTELTGFTITNGSSPNSGGGIMMYGTSPTISYCKIVNNEAVSFGGGIACLQNANPLLHHLEVSDNTADNGGGINVYLSNPILENILVTNNTGATSGGGLLISDCPELSLNKVTISQNTAQYGGAIMVTSSQFSITNSILWDNTPQEIYFNYYYEPNHADISYIDIEGGQGGMVIQNATVNMVSGNLNTNPMLRDDFRLRQFSPCIDTGDPASELDPDSSRADMGAFYFDHNTVSIDQQIEPIESFVLIQNFPNPFNPSTMIRYGLPDIALVSVIIYDVRGKVIRTFKPGPQPAGWHEQLWNGKDNSGQAVGTGIYLTRVNAGTYTQTIKMLYLK